MNINCKVTNKPFLISDQEQTFISNITFQFGSKSFQFPLPDISPDERMRQRTSHRNEQNMYWNTSAVDGTPLLSIYSADKPCKVYSQDYWFSDNWDPTDYAKEYDFHRPFFEQFYELSKSVPKANMVTMNNENSDYSTGTGFCKNCYLINSAEYVEDSYYGKLLQNCKNIVDSSYIYDSEICYQCFNLRKCYDCKYTYNSQNSSNCNFSDNLTGCKNCFLCTNLTNAEYFFMNKKLSKEDYESKIKEYTGYKGIQNALQEFTILRQSRIYKYSNTINSEKCSGDFIRGSKNCTDCYDMTDGEDCKYVQVGLGCKDVYDCSNMYVNPELSYQVLGVIETNNVHFSLYIFTSNDILYSENLYSCKNCFGCSGMRNKQYCILNKQYTKEAYEELTPRIIEHMKQDENDSAMNPSRTSGSWGRFFPSRYSMFSYNETLANDYLPLTKEQAEERGLTWKKDLGIIPEIKESIDGASLSDTISEVDDSILNKTILCEETSRPYKIVSQELKFYRLHNLPLPRKHPDVRHQERMTLRNPRKLWDRKCMKCGKDIKTTYAPDKPETIYCEECYLESIY